MVSCAPPHAVVNPQGAASDSICSPFDDMHTTSHLAPATNNPKVTPATNTSHLAPPTNTYPVSPRIPNLPNLPNTLSCSTIDGTTSLIFFFSPDTSRFKYAQYRLSINTPFQEIQSYPAIPDTSHSQPRFVSTIPQAQFIPLLQDGKWEVTKVGDLKYYGMRGRGGANPAEDDMDRALEAGQQGAAASNSGILRKGKSDVSHTSTGSPKRVSIAPQPGDIELGEIKPRRSTSAGGSRAQEGAPLVPSDASSSAQAPKKKGKKREKATNAVKKAHAKSHHVTNRITQAEDDCYQSCVRGMARLYNTWMNGEQLTQAQRENREIIFGFWKGLVVTASIGGIIGSGILHEFENGNLDLDKINDAFSNYTGSNASLFNNSFLDDKHWGYFLDDLKGLKEQEIAGSKTYSKGAFAVLTWVCFLNCVNSKRCPC